MLFRNWLLLFLFSWFEVAGQHVDLSTIAENGWAKNSVNTVIFRKNALTSFKDHQYAAYYDNEQYVVLAKRKLNSKKWQILRSSFKGDAEDAHKSISLMVDGEGYLHVSWGQHDNQLNYVRSIAPNSLKLGEKEQMIGKQEEKVSYPEFYRLANGNLLFFYRDGGSGNGNLIINRYDTRSKSWNRLQDRLISGEGKRNAYTQTTVDSQGTIHTSWVWRENPNVSSNHDLCYAKSTDGGVTWLKSSGERYTLPITLENAEYALQIPQESELINQTAMATDAQGNPFIASYWRPQGTLVPQYHIVYHINGKWQLRNLNFRTQAFTLSGGGTKKIPISRPQLVVWQKGKTCHLALLFRDVERGSKVSMAVSTGKDLNRWTCKDLTPESVGEWEPLYDTELWLAKKQLSIFVQDVMQVDGEGMSQKRPTAVQVLNWKL